MSTRRTDVMLPVSRPLVTAGWIAELREAQRLRAQVGDRFAFARRAARDGGGGAGEHDRDDSGEGEPPHEAGH